MQLVLQYGWRCLLLALAIAAVCCRQEFVSDSTATLRFSSDTLRFDTIFSPLGSTTFSCKVYNPGGRNLLFDEVRLRGESASPFRMNVDGRAGYSVGNVKLAKRDSLFIFLEVKKNQNLLLTDAVVFVVNGVELTSRLEVVAYGQDAVMFDRDTSPRNGYTFTAEKPYILNGVVTVDSDATVTVAAGAKLYFDTKAGVDVNGTLKVEGTPENPCIFSFPRYNDPWYRNAAEQWRGVSISSTGRASVSGAKITGAQCAFDVSNTHNTATDVQLTLSHSVVELADIGVQVSGGRVVADNCLFARYNSNAVLAQGGQCNFYHCTLTSRAYLSALVALQNYYLREKRWQPKTYDTIPAPLEVTFTNSIIYCENARGLSIREQKHRPADLNLTLVCCLVKLDNSYDLSNSDSSGNIINQNPMFRDVSKNDFHLSEKSPAINAGLGIFAIKYPVDADGYNRSTSNDRSLGCYAYRPEE
ncbi:MAG: hypothetical protein LBF67_03025 [Prevotellaceae bacterium]|jgi:hypothetical protein|nr:hypothetical protein [Prevotellaceae bacterium]